MTGTQPRVELVDRPGTRRGFRIPALEGVEAMSAGTQQLIIDVPEGVSRMIPPLTGRMRTSPQGAGNTSRGLTTSLDLGKEWL